MANLLEAVSRSSRRIVDDRRGVSMLEYSVLVVLVLIACIAAWQGLGEAAMCSVGLAQSKFVRELGGQAADQRWTERCAARAASTLPRALPQRIPPPAGEPEYAPALTPIAILPPGKIPGSIIDDLLNGKKPIVAIDENGPHIASWGRGVNDLASRSKTLQDDLDWAESNLRGGFVPGTRGDGTYYDPTTDTIVVDQQDLDDAETDPGQLVAGLAHELSHARHPVDDVDPSGRTKEEYIRDSTDANLRDESRANLHAAKVRREIKKKGGADIGIPGRHAADFAALEADKSLSTKEKEKRGAELFGGKDANGDGDYTDKGDIQGECPSGWACNTPCSSLMTLPKKHDPTVCVDPDDNYHKYYENGAKQRAKRYYKNVAKGAKAP